jgi:hypothetical protein
MLAYYEMTDKQSVLNAVQKGVALTMRHYGRGQTYFGIEKPLGGVSHGLMFIDILEWLYRLTGQTNYIDFAEFLYTDYSKFDNKRLNDSRLNDLLDPDREIVGHTPHVAEHLRVPLWLYHATGKDIYRKAYETGFKKLLKYVVPGGAVHSGEHEDVEGIAPEPHMPYEYCGITELLDTLESLLEKTGDTKYADHAEKLVMNAGQGARFADGTAVCYFSRDNRLKATDKGSGGRFKFSPTHEDIAVCCNPNAGKLLPYYVNRMWMRTDDPQGLVAVLYGPCSLNTKVKDVAVRIEQQTDFPFSEEIKFTVQPEKNITFALWFRIPEWATEMQFSIPNINIQSNGDYKIIEKEWQPEESFTVRFQTQIQTVKAVNGEIALKRGPLFYALPIPEHKETIKKYDIEGFADYNIIPIDTTLWTVHLDKNRQDDHFEFTFYHDASSNTHCPWAKPPLYLKGSVLDKADRPIPVTLYPMGATLLRRVTFSAY